jgi:pilus assembly protein FimV
MIDLKWVFDGIGTTAAVAIIPWLWHRFKRPSEAQPAAVAQEKIAPPRVTASSVPLPPLEPATLSEIQTKVHLAQAYKDLGDVRGARSILYEVLTEGSDSQRRDARRLLSALDKTSRKKTAEV